MERKIESQYIDGYYCNHWAGPPPFAGLLLLPLVFAITPAFVVVFAFAFTFVFAFMFVFAFVGEPSGVDVTGKGYNFCEPVNGVAGRLLSSLVRVFSLESLEWGAEALAPFPSAD